jgi:hypothetical protein
MGAVRRAMGEAAFARLPDEVREMLAREPLGAREIATRLVARGIGEDVVRLTYAVASLLPLVQLPPRGVWGSGGQVKYATLESWTGRELPKESSLDDLVVRYLGAFGPASVMDAQNWSGLTRLREVFTRLGTRLVTFRNDTGTELFDLPDAPRPPPDTPAPVRFLGEYDNVLLGHRDRSRIVPTAFPWPAMLAEARLVNTFLVDGMLRGTWWVEKDAEERETIAIRPFGALSAAEVDEVVAEARCLQELEFGAAGGVRFEAPAV